MCIAHTTGEAAEARDAFLGKRDLDFSKFSRPFQASCFPSMCCGKFLQRTREPQLADCQLYSELCLRLIFMEMLCQKSSRAR